MIVSRAFFIHRYAIDVIDTLVETDPVNGCGGRDLVYLLA
jgi:hypothetical protein